MFELLAAAKGEFQPQFDVNGPVNYKAFEKAGIPRSSIEKIRSNMRAVDFCVNQFRYLRTREACIRKMAYGPTMRGQIN